MPPPIRILPIGDSLTYGEFVEGGYRLPLFQLLTNAGYSVDFVPIHAAPRQGHSKIRLGSDGARFFLILLKVITIFSPLRIFLPISLSLLAGGAGYALWTIATQSKVANSSVVLILSSIIIFLIGLVSEQIASLRFEKPR